MIYEQDLNLENFKIWSRFIFFSFESYTAGSRKTIYQKDLVFKLQTIFYDFIISKKLFLKIMLCRETRSLPAKMLTLSIRFWCISNLQSKAWSSR